MELGSLVHWQWYWSFVQHVCVVCAFPLNYVSAQHSRPALDCKGNWLEAVLHTYRAGYSNACLQIGGHYRAATVPMNISSLHISCLYLIFTNFVLLEWPRLVVNILTNSTVLDSPVHWILCLGFRPSEPVAFSFRANSISAPHCQLVLWFDQGKASNIN